MSVLTRLHRSRTPRDGFDRRLIAPMLLGTVLNPINSSMIAVALIPIGAALGAPPSQTAWLVTGLYLATAIGQPVIGRLVDMFGPRSLYLIGTALVGVAGVVGVVAPGLGVLVAARVLLGFGTSAAYPAAMYLTRSEADRTGERSPAGVLTALSVSGQVIAVIGPTLGGLLIGLGGWHTIFAVNIPLSLACLVLGARRLPRRRPAAPAGVARLDLPGMALFTVMLVALMLFVMRPRLTDAYLLGVAAVAGALFAVRELRAAEPFIDLRVLGGNAPLLATYLRQFLAYVTSYAFLYGYTQWLEDGRGLGASSAGLVLLPLSASAIVIATLTGRHSAFRGKLLAGGVLQVLACVALLFAGGGTAVWLLVGVGVLMGLPQGLNGLANQNALYHQADAARMGSAAGLLRTFMYIGAMAASASNAAAFGHGATTAGLHHLALIMIVPGVLLIAATLLDRSLHHPARRP